MYASGRVDSKIYVCDPCRRCQVILSAIFFTAITVRRHGAHLDHVTQHDEIPTQLALPGNPVLILS